MNILKNLFRYNPFKWHIVSHHGGYCVRKFCFKRLWWGYSSGSEEDWCYLNRGFWLRLGDAQNVLANTKNSKEFNKQIFVEQ